MSVDTYSKIEYDVRRKGMSMKKIIIFVLILSMLCSCKEEEKPHIVTIKFSKLEIGEEETITEFVEVVEDGGAYKGNTAVWKFCVTLKRFS